MGEIFSFSILCTTFYWWYSFTRQIKLFLNSLEYSVSNIESSLCQVDIDVEERIAALKTCGKTTNHFTYFFLWRRKTLPHLSSIIIGVIMFIVEDVFERILDDKTAAESKTLIGHSGPVYGSSFNYDNSLLLTSSEDKTVRLWSLFTHTNIVCYKGHNYPVWDVQFWYVQ